MLWQQTTGWANNNIPDRIFILRVAGGFSGVGFPPSGPRFDYQRSPCGNCGEFVHYTSGSSQPGASGTRTSIQVTAPNLGPAAHEPLYKRQLPTWGPRHKNLYISDSSQPGARDTRTSKQVTAPNPGPPDLFHLSYLTYFNKMSQILERRAL